jgi:hypothetical protein
MFERRSESGTVHDNAAARRNDQAQQERARALQRAARVALRGYIAGERAVNAASVVMVLELRELPGRIHRILEECPIQVLTPDRLNGPLDERMRNR